MRRRRSWWRSSWAGTAMRPPRPTCSRFLEERLPARLRAARRRASSRASAHAERQARPARARASSRRAPVRRPSTSPRAASPSGRSRRPSRPRSESRASASTTTSSRSADIRCSPCSVHARINRILRSNLPLMAFFQTPTAAGLAQALGEAAPDPARSTLITLSPKGTRSPLFCVHGTAWIPTACPPSRSGPARLQPRAGLRRKPSRDAGRAASPRAISRASGASRARVPIR